MTERSLQERARTRNLPFGTNELLDKMADALDAKGALLSEAVNMLQKIEQLTWQEGASNITTYRDRLISCRRLAAEFLAKLKVASQKEPQ